LSSHRNIESSHVFNMDAALQHTLQRQQIRFDACFERRPVMAKLSPSRFRAAVSALVALALAAAAAPVLGADESMTNLGPVGPNEPILANIGGRRVIAYFVPERGSCAVNAINWKEAGTDNAPSRVRLSLRPGQMVQFDGAELAMNLLCGVDATTLAVVAPAELIFTSSSGRN
jgi:hypothetical protein